MVAVAPSPREVMGGSRLDQSRHQAVSGVEADDRGVASGIFETANHLFGGAVGVAVYATVIAAAGGYGPAFLVAAGLAACGLLVARIAPSGPDPSRP